MKKILDILKQNNFMFKKKFGQNFITDSNLLDAITNDALITKEDEVLEIGAGAGTLTIALANKCKKVLTIEIDNSLRPILLETFKDYRNIELYFADFMKISSSELNNHFDKKFKVVANLPYYITTPIIFKLINQGFNIDSITIMVQKEVADRLTAPSGTKDYGSITAQIASIADVKVMRIVSRKMFTPMPSVDSAIVNISLHPNKFVIKDFKLHSKVIEAAFSMRRKTLSNCLKSKLNLSTEEIEKLFNSLDFHSQIRGEVLGVEHFVKLSNAIYDLIKR